MRIGTSLTERLGFIAFAIFAIILAIMAFTRLSGSEQDSAMELNIAAQEPTPAPTTQPLSLPEPTSTPIPTPTALPSPTAVPTQTPIPEPELGEGESETAAAAPVPTTTSQTSTSPTTTAAPTQTAVAAPTVVPPSQPQSKPLPTAVITPVPGAGPSAQDSAAVAARAQQAATGPSSTTASGRPLGAAPTGAAPAGTAPAGTDPGPVSGELPSQSGGPQTVSSGPIVAPPAAPRGGTFTHTLTARVARPTLYRTPGGQAFTPTFNGTALPAQNPTVFGRPLVYRVLAGTPTDNSGWAQVYVPARPNGTTAWVRTSEFSWGQSNHLIRINVTTRTVTVLTGNQQVLSTPAVLGKSSSPTPIASGWVEEVIPGPNAAYGPTLISLGIYSDALNAFGGRVPKIALHGTNRPDLIGQYASNGCIRVDNSMIQQIAATVPIGSKVEIVR